MAAMVAPFLAITIRTASQMRIFREIEQHVYKIEHFSLKVDEEKYSNTCKINSDMAMARSLLNLWTGEGNGFNWYEASVLDSLPANMD